MGHLRQLPKTGERPGIGKGLHRRQWRDHAAGRLLRDRFRRQYRPCVIWWWRPNWRGLRQHLERHLLRQRHASAPGFSGRLQDINSDGRSRRHRALRRHHRARRSRRHRYRPLQRARSTLAKRTMHCGHALPKDGITPTGEPETIVSEVAAHRRPPDASLRHRRQGQSLSSTCATATNSCQAQNRMPNVPWRQALHRAGTRGGIWRYDANKTGTDILSRRALYATGIRNADGASPSTKAALGLYARHSRAATSSRELAKALQRRIRARNLPAEELLQVKQGDDFGWPSVLFRQWSSRSWCSRRNMAATEARRSGLRAEKGGPSPSSPPIGRRTTSCSANGARNSPPAYQGGAFIAFHGSLEPRAIAARRLQRRVPTARQRQGVWGNMSCFADGFAGGHLDPGRAAHRPSGGGDRVPTARFYIADDQHGRIWRVTLPRREDGRH